MIDTHAHYDDERYDNDREALFEEIKKALPDWEFSPSPENQIRTTTKEFIFKIKK